MEEGSIINWISAMVWVTLFQYTTYRSQNRSCLIFLITNEYFYLSSGAWPHPCISMPSCWDSYPAFDFPSTYKWWSVSIPKSKDEVSGPCLRIILIFCVPSTVRHLVCMWSTLTTWITINAATLMRRHQGLFQSLGASCISSTGHSQSYLKLQTPGLG